MTQKSVLQQSVLVGGGIGFACAVIIEAMLDGHRDLAAIAIWTSMGAVGGLVVGIYRRRQEEEDKRRRRKARKRSSSKIHS